MNVYIVNGNPQYKRMFEKLNYVVVDDMLSSDLVCFTGGEDVSPSMYGHEKHNTTGSNINRDRFELDVFDICFKRNIPMVGICRGGQFLNVASGGEMYQDCTSHTQSHMITDVETGLQVWASSTHHQMMKPKGNHTIIAVGSQRGSRTYWDNTHFVTEQSRIDIEVVHYPETQCICFQPHPEFGTVSEQYETLIEYFDAVIQHYLFANEAA